ncbi:hypothetical protein LCGC14_0884840 [marine sediment metagenome]|uniref:Uncharacterized protein n=1 Tax=marine sediment metagenome TaxID=412755 RepID=A0A0F9PLJ7_9ZZZZ
MQGKEITDKQFKQKLWIFFGIIICVVAIAFFVGASSYGFPLGIKTAQDYYKDYYMPEFCECRDPEEVITYGKDWVNYSLLPDLYVSSPNSTRSK